LPPAMLADDDAGVEVVVEPGAGAHLRGLDRQPVAIGDAARWRRCGTQLDFRMRGALVQAGQRVVLMRSSSARLGMIQHWRLLWDVSLMDEAGLTIIAQRTRMDRYDRPAGHHVLDLQGRERGVQPSEIGEVLDYCLNHGIAQLI